MKRLGILTLGLILCAAWAPAAFAQARKSEGPALVGRISFIEGQLLRYVYDEQDWVATVKDAPFGLEDAVYSSDSGKAEFKMPNGIWVRIGADTQIQLIALRDDAMEVDVASGTARFYDKSQSTVVKATTPFGYVLAQPGTAFDLYVGDESTEVICLDGTVDFILGDGEARFVVEAGGGSLISDGRQTVEGDGMVDSGWDQWNLSREETWAQRIQVKGESYDYLPPQLYDDAYDLEQHGRWERVYYQGEYRRLWRPTAVATDWQPFTSGRWTVWYDDNVWIPEEEFGYVTHHYGNWVFANSAWYWAPPVRVRVGYLADCVCWYPGRVAWIYSGVNVGWVPLAPTEVYYSHHHWGPASYFVGAGVGAININVRRLAYVNHAVVVNQTNIYNVNSYRNVRVTNINRTTIINNYRAAPVVNNRVISNYNTIRNRHVYNTNLARISAKPHQAVVQRINHNRTISTHERQTISGKALQQSAARVKQGTPLRGPQAAQQVQKPRITGKIVPEGQVTKPKSEVQFQQRQLKSQEKKPEVGQMKRSVRQPEVGRPGEIMKPAEQVKPGVRTRKGDGVRTRERIKPAEGVQSGQPATKGERVRTRERAKQGGTEGKVGQERRLRDQRRLQQEYRQQRIETQRQQQLRERRRLQEQSPGERNLRQQQRPKRIEQDQNLKGRSLQQQQRPPRMEQQKMQQRSLQHQRPSQMQQRSLQQQKPSQMQQRPLQQQRPQQQQLRQQAPPQQQRRTAPQELR